MGKDFCFQYQYEFFVARTTALEAVSTPVPSVSPGSVPLEASDTGVSDIGNFRSKTERPLGTKAAKTKKRSLESSSSSQADVVSSVRDFSEVIKKSDEELLRTQRQ
jgi:hypothetical protein